ncbi:hypothetical protein DFAR_3690003 [Desulfarculales bacterium]
MPINPILDKLRALGLEDMLNPLEEQLSTPEVQKLGFEERLGLMEAGRPPIEKTAGSKTG